MTRRQVLVALGTGCFAAESTPASVRGRLTERAGTPALEIPGGNLVALEADQPTTSVLRDRRLRGSDFEARGRFTAPDRFRIDPIHTGAIFAYRGGKRLRITYWCDTCSIRTYTPGTCWCCQEETALDLRDPETPPEGLESER